MTSLQAWLVVGIPALAATAAMFAGRSSVRAGVGYLILALTLVFFLLVPEDVISASVIGAIGFLLIAVGRGSASEEEQGDHHGVPERVGDPRIPDPGTV